MVLQVYLKAPDVDGPDAPCLQSVNKVDGFVGRSKKVPFSGRVYRPGPRRNPPIAVAPAAFDPANREQEISRDAQRLLRCMGFRLARVRVSRYDRR